MSFDTLGLSPEVLRAVAETGYTTPTPIQEKAIPQVLMGRDVLGIAQTGTGKTASFTLPMLSILGRGRSKARMPRSLILEPTRELAAQVADAFEVYGKHLNLTMALLIGGVSFAEQDAKLNRGVDVLIATPGRLLDQFERGKVLLTGTQILVVDEADRMLDMGFIPDVERIFKLTSFTRQTLFFSATMPPEIQRLTDQFLHNPVRIEVARAATTAENVEQILLRCSKAKKRDRLVEELSSQGVKNAIIFCNRKRDIGVVTRALTSAGLEADALHGDLDQSVRTKVLDTFRAGEIRFLVASDVAARGLDIPAVSHIVNFDVPSHPEDYVHRIGRTGRAGRKGKAITLVTDDDEKYVQRIEKLIGRELPKDAAPAGQKEAQPSKEEAGEAQKAKPRRQRGKPSDEAKATKPVESDEAGTSKSAGRGRRRKAGKAPPAEEETATGLGDHVPAFLLRPVFPGTEDQKVERKGKARRRQKSS